MSQNVPLSPEVHPYLAARSLQSRCVSRGQQNSKGKKNKKIHNEALDLLFSSASELPGQACGSSNTLSHLLTAGFINALVGDGFLQGSLLVRCCC